MELQIVRDSTGAIKSYVYNKGGSQVSAAPDSSVIVELLADPSTVVIEAPDYTPEVARPRAIAELKARGVAALDGAGYLPFKQIQMLLVLLAETIKSHAALVRATGAAVDTTALEAAAGSIPALTELTLSKVLALAGEIATVRGQLNSIEEQINAPAATVESIRAALAAIPSPRKAADVEASA